MPLVVVVLVVLIVFGNRDLILISPQPVLGEILIDRDVVTDHQ
jgi:hypothetical protein